MIVGHPAAFAGDYTNDHILGVVVNGSIRPGSMVG
jgi:hypothetical protein